jgi:hypothetical protein
LADLYELEELASYMQTDLDAATAELNRELVTSAIRRVVGRRRWAVMTDDQASDLKGLALDIAKSLTLNPESRRAESIDDYSYTNATETLRGVKLTETEQEEILAIFGQRGGAFSIAPAAPTTYCAPTYRRY